MLLPVRSPWQRLQVGKAMSSNESAAYDIMQSLGVDYVLVIFGGVIGYSGDDINKFLWMVRIAEGEHPRDIKVRQGGINIPITHWSGELSLDGVLYKSRLIQYGDRRFGKQIAFSSPNS